MERLPGGMADRGGSGASVTAVSGLPEPLKEEKTLHCSCEITARQACKAMVKVTLYSPQGDRVGEKTEEVALQQGEGKYLVTLSDLKESNYGSRIHRRCIRQKRKLRSRKSGISAVRGLDSGSRVLRRRDFPERTEK